MEIAVSLLNEDGNLSQQRLSVVETSQILSLRAIIRTVFNV